MPQVSRQIKQPPNRQGLVGVCLSRHPTGCLQLRGHVFGDRQKGLFARLVNGHGSAVARQQSRVFVHTCHAVLKVQVWTSRPAGTTHFANVVASLYVLAFANQNTTQVRIQGGIFAVMLNLDDIAVAALNASKGHAAITHSPHQSASRRAVVYAQVTLPPFLDRVEPHGKVTGDSRKLHRRGQVKTPCAVAV